MQTANQIYEEGSEKKEEALVWKDKIKESSNI